MKKILILVMLLSFGLTGIVSARSGELLYKWWDGGTGDLNAALNQQRDNDPSGEEMREVGIVIPDWAGKDDWSSSLEGWITPPETGDYTFWWSSDDHGGLWLASEGGVVDIASINTGSAIATVDGWSDPGQWDKYGSQQSSPISLNGGQAYHFYAAMRDGGGGGHMQAAWGGGGIANNTVISVDYVSFMTDATATGPAPAGPRFRL